MGRELPELDSSDATRGLVPLWNALVECSPKYVGYSQVGQALKEPKNQCIVACDIAAASPCKFYAAQCATAASAAGPWFGAAAGVGTYGICNVGIHYYCENACANAGGESPSADYYAP